MGEPVWLAEARRHVGVREIVGPKHSPVIMDWIAELGAVSPTTCLQKTG